MRGCRVIYGSLDVDAGGIRRLGQALTARRCAAVTRGAAPSGLAAGLPRGTAPPVLMCRGKGAAPVRTLGPGPGDSRRRFVKICPKRWMYF